jgi:hypothetical protein
MSEYDLDMMSPWAIIKELNGYINWFLPDKDGSSGGAGGAQAPLPYRCKFNGALLSPSYKFEVEDWGERLEEEEGQ